MNDDERVGPSKLFTILCGRVTPAEGPAAKRGGGGGTLFRSGGLSRYIQDQRTSREGYFFCSRVL